MGFMSSTLGVAAYDPRAVAAVAAAQAEYERRVAEILAQAGSVASRSAAMQVDLASDASVDPRSYFGDYHPNKDLQFLSLSDCAPLWKK